MATTYKIGEAAALLSLKTYVLRFWETEFPDIAPLRTEKGQRLYTPDHLALLERIRFLLHERGLTIGGARKILAEEKARGVVYVFGAPGAVEGADAGAALAGEGDALQRPPGLPPEYDLDEDGGQYEPDEPDEPDEQDEDEAGLDYAHRDEQALAGPSLLPAQYNLPGLEGLPPARPVVAEAPPAREACGAQPEDAREGGAPKGMLPLFSVGKKSPGAAAPQGGGNFIPSGGAREQPGKALAEHGAAREQRRRALLDIADELEAVAAMLRR